MDTEKIKQMGRDYFAANGITLEIPSRDDAFWNAWNGSEAETLLIGQSKEAEYAKWKTLWYEGFKETMCAKESRAIELLGRLFIEHPSTNLRPAWVAAGKFLEEIGWKLDAWKGVEK